MSWLFSRNPPTICRLPKPFSIVVVIDTALPSASTIEMWLVEGSAAESSMPLRAGAPAGRPATGTPMERSIRISAARARR